MSRRQLRVLPLGGLGEIGKNMTVVEYDGPHRRRRLGPALPDRRHARASTSCCPTSPTCASASTTSRRSSSPTATRTTSARCRGSCASWARDSVRRLRRPADHRRWRAPSSTSTACARSTSRTSRTATARARAVRGRARAHDALDPRRRRRDRSDHAGWARSSSPATTSSTRRRSTACPPTSARLAELGQEDLLLLCGDSTNADRPGFSPQRGDRRAASSQEVFAALRGAHRGHLLRLEHPSRPAGRRRRRRARAQGLAGRALDAQERQHRALAGPHRRARGDARAAARDRGLARREARDRSRPGPRASRSVGAAAHGPPRPPAGRAAPAATPCVFSRHPDPGQRARRQRDDRPPLPHRLRRDHDPRRADPRLRARLRRRSSS